jgi:hypothetical protein
MSNEVNEDVKSDTPETDAFRKEFEAHYANISDLFEHAEKLERDRNEWKMVAEGSLLGAINERDESRRILADANKRIDELLNGKQQ